MGKYHFLRYSSIFIFFDRINITWKKQRHILIQQEPRVSPKPQKQFISLLREDKEIIVFIFLGKNHILNRSRENIIEWRKK